MLIDVSENVVYFWKNWRHILEKGDQYYNPNLTLDSDNFFINTRQVFIEHHEPFLVPGTEIKYHKFSPIDTGSIEKILVIKLDHIGDVILGLPAVKMLRSRFPKSHITMLVGRWATSIVEKIAEVDNFVIFDFFNEKSEEGRRNLSDEEKIYLKSMLQPFNFDLAIDLRRHHETRDVLRLAGARYTVGYCTGGDDEWLSVSLQLTKEIEDICFQTYKQHITAQMCQLVQAIPFKSSMTDANAADPPDISLPLLSFDKEGDTFKGYSDLLHADFLVGVHPGAGSSIRQWPLSHFARLADLLIERKNAKVILFGGRSEKDLVSNMLKGMQYRDKAVSLAGEISLEEFMTIIKRCHLFIGNISGPCHISGIVGVPTLAIFGGQVLPHEWHPLGKKTLSVRVDVHCSPCYKAILEQCPYDLKCLKFLWPEKVWEAVQQLMAISGKDSIRKKD